MGVAFFAALDDEVLATDFDIDFALVFDVGFEVLFDVGTRFPFFSFFLMKCFMISFA